MDYYPIVVLNIVIIIDICLLTASIFIFRYIFEDRLNKIVAQAVGALSCLLDETYDIGGIMPDKYIMPFYDKLKEVHGELAKKENTRREVLTIANSIAVNMELTDLLDDLLPKIIKATDSACAAFYMANHLTNKLEIKASVGFSKSIYGDFDMTMGEGLIGQTGKDIKIIKDIPDDSVFFIKTYLGKIKPKSIMIIPIIDRDVLVGVLSLASLFNFKDDQNEIIELMRYYVGVSIGNAKTYEQTKRLTNELRFQNTLIQNLNEDLERKVDSRTVFLNNIIDSILDYAIYAFDNKRCITAWNKAAEQILGFLKDEVIGKNVEDILPDNYQAGGGLQNKIELATRNGRYEESGRRVKKDGAYYFYEYSMFPMYNAENDVVGFTNVIKDITYLKNIDKTQSYEKEFTRKIVQTSADAAVIANMRGFLHLSNEKAEELLGQALSAGDDFCAFFAEPDFLRRNLTDSAERYGRGDWLAVHKKTGKTLGLNVFTMAEAGDPETKLFIYITEREG